MYQELEEERAVEARINQLQSHISMQVKDNQRLLSKLRQLKPGAGRITMQRFCCGHDEILMVGLHPGVWRHDSGDLVGRVEQCSSDRNQSGPAFPSQGFETHSQKGMISTIQPCSLA